MSIVADTRLNCLVVQALPVDVQLVEQLLKVIDREGSITDVETAGKPHILPIQYLEAEQVAGIVREAFASRMATAGGGQAGGQPNPVELIRALRGGRGGRSDSDVKNEEAKMTITVDNRSNSLIVTAPEPLFEQVEELVALIDQGSPELEEDVDIVSLKNSNPDTVQRALAAIIGTTSSQSATSRTQSGQRPGFQFGMPFGAASQGGGMPSFMGGQRGGMGGMPGGMGGMPGGMGGLVASAATRAGWRPARRHGWLWWTTRRNGRQSGRDAGRPAWRHGRPTRLESGTRPSHRRRPSDGPAGWRSGRSACGTAWTRRFAKLRVPHSRELSELAVLSRVQSTGPHGGRP